MRRTWKAFLLCCSLISVCLVPTEVRAAQSSESAKSSTQEIDSVLLELGNAINGGNINATMSFWADDAIFVDQAGEQTRGKAALEARFSRLYEQRGKDTLQLHPSKISTPAANVAIIAGEVSRKHESIELPASRFTMVLVKNADRWLINEATETVIQEKNAADHLKLVSWLEGKWTVSTPEHSVLLEVKWSENRNLLLSTSTAEKKDGSKQVDYQIIGFDPRSNSIVSWHFASNGGFGYGKWTKEKDLWRVNYAGVDKDGASTTATNIFTPKSATEFTWQSVGQTDGDDDIPDTGVVTLQRAR